jgi:hypothetical protein
MNTELRDSNQTSRKGRKPKNDKATTPAERKRQQRQRQREAKSELPSWLRLRRDLWKVIQDHFMFEDVDELVCALRALEAALTLAHVARAKGKDWDFWTAGLMAFNNPPEELNGALGFFQQIGRYQFEELGCADRKGAVLFDILRDIMECHEKA